jgi:hypothetical protein
MIYTCYEMIQDCRADKPEGWSYLIATYVPLIRKLLAHYAGPGDSGELERVLVAARQPESSLFHSVEPAPERWFIAELRQKVLAELHDPKPEIEVDLETVASAFEPLTMIEKQVAWIETMSYDHATTGAMLRMAPQTVEKMRERAAELLRGKVDLWRRTLLAENGRALGRAAAAVSTNDCLQAKFFLDVLDGRTTWRGRETMEQHLRSCWRCIDHFSRMAEVVELIRGVQPLTEAEAEPFRKLLGLGPAKKKAFWKMW